MAQSFEMLLANADDFTLWMSVAQASFDRRSLHGIESLTRIQRIVLGVWVASGMIGNRGFYDHSPEEMAEWVQAYEELGMSIAAKTVREASNLMSTIDWERDDPAEQLLDPIERQYYADNERTAGLVAALIRNQPAEAFAELAAPARD